jgi:hypothetical protein
MKTIVSKLSTQSSLLSPHYLCFSIADITYGIISVDPDLKLKIQDTTEKFLFYQTDPDMTIEARRSDLSEMGTRGKKVFDSGVLWRLYNYNGKYLFSFTSPVLGSIPYKIAKVNKDFSECEVLLHRPYFDSDQPVYPLEYPLDELLFVNYLALGKGVEVHACGITDSQGRGHLFVGQSSAGKSTIARLWQDEPDVTILSDDRIILRKIENTIWVYGTPWHGEAGFASPDRGPLTRVYFLTHGSLSLSITRKPSTSL